MNNPFDKLDLWEKLDAHITTRETPRPPSGNFFPSEASVVYTDKHGDKEVGGACLRKSWYRLKGFSPEPHSAYSQYIFQMGHNFEDDICKYLGEMKLLLEREHKFFVDTFGFPIKGALDVIISDPTTEKPSFLELKTVYGYYAAKEVLGNKKEKGYPKLSHLLQTFLYLVLFSPERQALPRIIERGENGEDVVSDTISPYVFSAGRMLYFFRDSMKRVSFLIEAKRVGNNIYPVINGELIKTFSFRDIIERYMLLKQFINGDTPPPRDFERQYSKEKIRDYRAKGKISDSKVKEWERGKSMLGDPLCSDTYCPYYKTCWLK